MAQPVRLTIEEAAAQSGVSVSTLQKLTASAEITSVRIGRRRLYVLDQLVAELEDRGRRDRVVVSGGRRAAR